MSHFLSYAIPGIPYGCNYALMAVGLVLTFRATGVFNLAFGAQAFVAAFIFDLLVRTNHLPVGLAFVLAVLVFSPLLGLALDRFLFRHIPTASTTAKLVSSLGLLIAIPQALPIFFGNGQRLNPPNLWLNPNHVYFHVFSTPINGGEVTTTVITVVVAAAVVAMFRWTDIGLQMRAVVESRRMSQLEGINSPRVAAGAWALSSALAGLAGVLLLPLTAAAQPDRSAPVHRAAGGGPHRRGGGEHAVVAHRPGGGHRTGHRREPAVGISPLRWRPRPDRRPRLPLRRAGGDAAAQSRPAPARAELRPVGGGRPAPGTPVGVDPRPPSRGPDARRLLGPGGGLPGVECDLGAGLLRHRLRRRPVPVDRLPVHHAHYRHERAALVVPGGLRRHRRLRGGAVRRRIWACPCCSARWWGACWPR